MSCTVHRRRTGKNPGFVRWILPLIVLVGLFGAAPDAAAQAPPADRLRVLFLGDENHHQPFARAKESLPVLARNGIDMFYTNDPAALAPDRLADYHALIFYHNHATISQDQLNALLEFVSNGGGLAVIHAGSASFQNAEAYVRLVGGAFKSHGTGVFTTRRVVSNHPALRDVPTFESWDETYVHTKHNPVNRTVLEVRVEDDGREEPYTWVRTYGNGRVFYTAWGHDERTWSNEGFQRLLVSGVRWAAGDWAVNQAPREPAIAMQELAVPLPNYVPGAAWGTLGEPVWEAQAPLEPEESFALTTLPAGFSIELFAMEPMIGRIIDFTWDERGRMWAVETNDYPHALLPDSVPGSDRILILEDTDGDGMADDVTVFAEGLNLATTLVLIRGGVVVGQAPHILYLRDIDGDDRADTREQIMTGWPRNDTHGALSNFRYNIDNQILGSVGYNGFRGTVAGRTYGAGEFGSGYFRFTPDGQSIDYLARTSNNTWGVALSEEGLIFGSTANNRPSNFVHIPARYYHSLGMPEPTLPGIEDRADIYPVTDILQVDQFGLYTAGAAHEIYTARAFPSEYWNRKAFVADPTGNLIGMFDLRRDGSGYRARNEWSFLASRDSWVSPVQVKVGPDGALWVADFYSLVVQHNPYVEMEGCCPRGEGNAYETPNRDAERARIYRISYDGAPPYTPLRLDNASPAELVQALRHDNMFWRYTAQRLLVERGQTDVVPALIELVMDHTVDELGLNPGALHALWTLHGLGALESNPDALQAVAYALHHPAASVRRAALMAHPRGAIFEENIFAAGILPDRTAPGQYNVNTGNAVLQDADPTVRLEALLALSELPASERAGMAIRDMIILPVNARDRWIPDAAAIAAARHAPGLALELLQREYGNADAAYIVGMRSVVQLLARYFAQAQDAARVVELLVAAADAHPELAAGVFAGVVGPPQGTRPFRAELRGRPGGWPQDSPPALTAEQRAALAAAAQRSPELAADYARVAEFWGMGPNFQPAD